jgi:hypothetical protein
MTYADLPLLCTDCECPTLLMICTECGLVHIATVGLTGRRCFDVLDLETYLREFAAHDEPRCRFGGAA